MAEDTRVQRQLAGLDEIHDRDRRDRLGHAGNAEQVRGRERRRAFAIGDAERLDVDHPAVPRDGDGEAGDAVLRAEAFGERRHFAALGRRDLVREEW